jgi:hypothetical protein
LIFGIQVHKEIVKSASVDVPQLDQNADTDIQFAGFIFGVGASSKVTSS